MHSETAEIIDTLKAFSVTDAVANQPIPLEVMVVTIFGTGVIAAVAAVVRKASNGPRSSLLAMMGSIGLYAGLATGLYGAVIIGTAMMDTHTRVTQFALYGPEALDIAAILLSGAIVYLIARIGNAGARKLGA